MSEFMKRFKQLRTAKGITQAQLAEDLNVTQTAITYWENGKREPNIDMFKKIAEYFNVSLDYLISGTSYTPSRIVEIIAEKLSDGYNPSDLLKSSDLIQSTAQLISEDRNKQELLDCYDSLNNTGKQEAAKRVTELTEIKKYTEPENN